MYVTDTHALALHARPKPSRLGKQARRIFQDADLGRSLIYVPSVVLWEIWKMLADGKIELTLRFDHWCRELDRSEGFEIRPLGWEAVDEARRFPFRDPFDCLIAGTATHLGMPLITKDEAISNSGLIETIW